MIKDKVLMREMGFKLKDFRIHLARLKGKLNQRDFGQRFGGYNINNIAKYEIGHCEVPALLLYRIWEAGQSIDELFRTGQIQKHHYRTERQPSIAAEMRLLSGLWLYAVWMKGYSIDAFFAKYTLIARDDLPNHVIYREPIPSRDSMAEAKEILNNAGAEEVASEIPAKIVNENTTQADKAEISSISRQGKKRRPHHFGKGRTRKH